MLANSDGVEVEMAVLVAGFGLATRGGRQFVVRSVEDGAATGELDARVLAVRESEMSGRHLPFQEAVPELPGTECTKLPIPGPRTTRWVCQFIRDQDRTAIEACALEGRRWAQHVGPS